MLAPVGQANQRTGANAERLDELILEAKAIFGPSLNLHQPKKRKWLFVNRFECKIPISHEKEFFDWCQDWKIISICSGIKAKNNYTSVNKQAVFNAVMTSDLIFMTYEIFLIERPYWIFYKVSTVNMVFAKPPRASIKNRVSRNGRPHWSVQILKLSNMQIRILPNGGVWLSMFTVS